MALSTLRAVELIDLQKNYEFQVKIVDTEADWSTLTTATDIISSIANNAESSHYMTYVVNTLAKSIQVPARGVKFTTVTISTIDYSIPTGLKLDDITVTYLDDFLGTVYHYFIGWQDKIKVKDKGSSFNEIGKCVKALALYPLNTTLTGTVGNTLNSVIPGVAGDIAGSAIGSIGVPNSMIKWSYVYPADVKRSEFNKESEGVSEVTVVFKRIPYYQRNILDGGKDKTEHAPFVHNKDVANRPDRLSSVGKEGS